MGPRPDSLRFGGGASESLLSPIVLVGMLIAIVFILILPRKYIIAPFLLCIFLVPLGQQVYVGVHLLAPRIIILAGWARLLWIKMTSKEGLVAWGLNSVDQAFAISALSQAVCVVLLNMQSDALVNQFGFLIDFIGGYFLVRCLLRDEEDTYRAMKWFAFITVILAVGMVIEQMKLINIFGLLGGVQLVPEIREGKIRSQGVFQHSLMAGTFAATLLPLFFLLWKNGKAKIMAIVGVVGCTVMTMCSNSSTPLLAYVSGLVAICLWPIRKSMRKVRWGIVAVLAALQVVMKAPVWFLIARVDLTGGSSGYHRAELVDQFIRHFFDWWLIGTKDSGTWGYDLWDTQNQYVTVGEAGGLLAFVFFIAMISRAYARIGNARKSGEGTSQQEWFGWFLGAALFANLVGFFGVNYFDQSKESWFVLLAMISAFTAPLLQTQSVPEPQAAGRLTNARLAPQPLGLSNSIHTRVSRQ